MQWGDHRTTTDRLQRLWRSGQILADRLTPEPSLFPLRIPLKHPTARELSDHFDTACHWITTLREASQRHAYTLEWKAINHRLLGANQLPVASIIETPELALTLLRKQGEGKRFDSLAAQITAAFPELHHWVQRKPLKTLEYAEDWVRLLAILQWLRERPRPGCYLRQIDLPGVHTKFIEARRGLLTELLDIVLLQNAIHSDAIGARQFERRYGFRGKPSVIRFRLLDPTQAIHGLMDLSIPLDDFRRLAPPARHVFITENDINGLAFPERPDSLVIFGLGYGLDALKDIPWLAECAIYYWGDIDTHGFAMLDRLRGYHPHTHSLLMDETTLLQHRALWGREDKPTHRDLPNLENEEQALYDALRKSHHQENLRLEQERISYSRVEQVLEAVIRNH